MENTINTNIKKGITMLNEAISQYQDGNLSNAYELYKAAGELLGEANETLKTIDGIASMRYGDNRNFAVIYKVFESNTKDMMKTRDGQKNIKRIINLIRENAVLKNEFDAYNAFTNPTNVIDVENYVNEAVSLINKHSIGEIKDANNKFLSVLRNCNINENIDIDDEDAKLYESIEYMILTPKTFNTINQYNSIQKQLCEYVTKNNKLVLSESKKLDKLYDEKINEVVAKQEELLNEDEVNLIKETSNVKKAKKLFSEYKSKVISMIEEQLKSNTVSNEWKSILNEIKKKEFSQSTALTDIAELIEIHNEIED